MKNNNGLNIFISYCHLDEDNIKEFKKHMSPLNGNNSIEFWHDRKIIAGQSFQDEIDNNLENADIICLFISANFLYSPACQNEKKIALELLKKNGVSVVPIILSACGWLDDKEISSLLALPQDGKSIENFDNFNNAWNCVYNGLKLVIEEEVKIKQLEVTEQFSSFLESTELLIKCCSYFIFYLPIILIVSIGYIDRNKIIFS